MSVIIKTSDSKQLNISYESASLSLLIKEQLPDKKELLDKLDRKDVSVDVSFETLSLSMLFN